MVLKCILLHKKSRLFEFWLINAREAISLAQETDTEAAIRVWLEFLVQFVVCFLDS